MSKKKVKDVFELQMGKTPSRSNREYWDGGEYDWVSIRDLGTFEKFVGKTAEAITEKALSESKIKSVPPNTLIMSFKLSIGKTAITTSTTYTNEAIMAFLDKGLYPINLDYFYHQFTGRNWTAGTNKAVMGATLNKKTLGEMLIHVPSIDEQREIAKILDQLDLDIRMERQRISKLDQLVKSEFVEMFGSSVNDTPWPTERVESIAHVNVGVVIKPAQYYVDDVTKGVRAFRSLNVQPMHIKDDDWVYFSLEGNAKNRKSVLAATDVLIVRSGYPGTSCVVGTEYEGANAVDLIIAHPDLTRVDPVYLAAFNNYPIGQQQIKAGIGGAAQQHFNVGRYKGLTIPVPPIELQQEYASFVAQVDKSQYAVRRSIEQLELLKAKLMQEYFS